MTQNGLWRETIDVPLAERARRVNEACGRYGRANVVLISIHVNAAGDGTEWRGARGWSAYTSPGKTKADTLATMTYEEAETHLKGQQIRRDTQDGDEDWEANFYMLRKTKCPAVLTENFFMDNRMGRGLPDLGMRTGSRCEDTRGGYHSICE